MSQLQLTMDAMRRYLAQHILGKEQVIDKVLAALLCGGHVLLNDIPGTGKTTLARSLAASMDADFHRIQFTPDLLPSDLIGVSIPDPETGKFVFHKGAVFTQILLADEINRAAPRTQSALLECMEEHQVTAEGVTYALEEPFFVIATQNPVEMQGTFPLPEAQLDRFLLCLTLGYPDREQEIALLARQTPKESQPPVITAKALLEMRRTLEQVTAAPAVLAYVADLAEASRTYRNMQLGLSTRGMLSLLDVSKAVAAMRGRTYVTPEDVKYLAADCMAHRMTPKGGQWDSRDSVCRAIVQELLETVPVPKETLWN